MKKTYFILLCLLSISLLSFSQEGSEEDTWDPSSGQKYKNYIGIGGGGTAGFGLAYKYMPKKFGVMLTAAPYYSKARDVALISGGLTLERVIAQSHSSSLFVYFSNSVLYNNNVGFEFLPLSFEKTKSGEYTWWNSGIGLGLEVHAAKKVVINVMAGYAQYDNFNSMFLTGELFLFYRFN